MSDADQSGAGRREVAYRMFAAEFDDADFSYSESDEDRAPNYVITPTGARANRLFVVGVLTEVETVSDDVLRARVVDPTGAFVLYAGQYQPDEQAFLEAADPPTFVAVTGKARTFQPDDGDRIFTSIRPESISEVDAETRDRWTVQAAEQTVERVGWMAHGLASGAEGETLRTELRQQGADDGLAHGISLALDHYGTTPTYLDAMREMALDAARVVAGEQDEVEPPEIAPDEAGAVTAADLADATADARTASETAVADVTATESASPDAETPEQPSTESSGSEPEPEPNESADETAEADNETPEESAAESGTEEESAAESGTEESAATSEPVEGTESASSDSADDEDLGDFEPDEFELESETREQIEEEYGTDFQTGTEVDEPGEADIETPAEEQVEAGAESPGEESEADTSQGRGTEETAGAEDEAEDAGPEDEESPGAADVESEDAEDVEVDEAEPEDTADEQGEEPAESAEADDDTPAEEPEDVQATVVDLMGELDDGSGADREALFSEMADRYGVDRETVEDAIQDALMDGQCYEPDDDSLKPI